MKIRWLVSLVALALLFCPIVILAQAPTGVDISSPSSDKIVPLVREEASVQERAVRLSSERSPVAPAQTDEHGQFNFNAFLT